MMSVNSIEVTRDGARLSYWNQILSVPLQASKLSGFDGQVVCGCAILPLKLGIGESRGPAPRLDSGDSQDDIIDETLFLYRANSLFRNYLPEGPADRTLIYLTLFVQQCLKELEKIDEKSKAERTLQNVASKSFPAPGEAGWPLGTIFPSSESRADVDLWKAYMTQCREELARRLVGKVFVNGCKSKWWQLFSKHKFIGKSL